MHLARCIIDDAGVAFVLIYLRKILFFLIHIYSWLVDFLFQSHWIFFNCCCCYSEEKGLQQGGIMIFIGLYLTLITRIFLQLLFYLLFSLLCSHIFFRINYNLSHIDCILVQAHVLIDMVYLPKNSRFIFNFLRILILPGIKVTIFHINSYQNVKNS